MMFANDHREQRRLGVALQGRHAARELPTLLVIVVDRHGDAFLNVCDGLGQGWGVDSAPMKARDLNPPQAVLLPPDLDLHLIAATHSTSLGDSSRAHEPAPADQAAASKEYRYVLPVLALFGALAGLGIEALWRSEQRKLAYRAACALLATALWSAAQFHALTLGDIGPYEKTRPAASAYDDWGPVNRLLVAAHRRPDLCGLKIETDQLVWLGGYSYLHRPVPLYPATGPPRDSGLYNYVITARGQEPSDAVAADGDRVLVRLSESCTPDPSYDWRLARG